MKLKGKICTFNCSHCILIPVPTYNMMCNERKDEISYRYADYHSCQSASSGNTVNLSINF